MAPHPNSLANLRKFPKGKSGNPGGAKKKTEPTVREWRDFALESPGADKNGKPLPARNDIVMRTLFLIATDRRRKDVVKAIDIWIGRVYGKVPDKVQVAGKIETGDNPLTSFLWDAIQQARRKSAEAEAEQREGDDDEEDNAPPGG